MDRQQGQDEVENGGDLGDRAVALAEQLGRIIGTIEGTAESWMNRPALAEQLIRVRDGANRVLKTVGSTAAGMKGAGKKKTPKRAAAGRKMADKAHAPGKRHRKPAPNAKGVKKSDQRIAKMRTAQAARQRRKSYA